jgi:hypothetical protein
LRITAPYLFAGLVLSLRLPHAWAQTPDERSPLDHQPNASLLAGEDGPAGFRAGSFRVYPSASISAGYDSNVFATQRSQEADEMSLGQAVVRVDNESDKLAVDGTAFIRARRFPDTSAADTNEYGLATDFDAALGSQDELTGLLLAQRKFEARTEVETPNNIAVSYYDELRSTLTYRHTFNRITAGMTAGARRLQYADRTQEYRNRWSYSGELRGSYELHNGISLLAIGYLGRDDFKSSSIIVDSAKTTGALVGGRLDLTDVVDFELSGGPFKRSYAAGRGELTGVSIRGALVWQPTRLTSVRADIVREDQPTRVLGVLGKVRTDVSLQINHSYSYGLLFHARGRVVFDDYDVIAHTDKTYIAEAGIDFLLSRDYAITVLYDYGSRSSHSYFESFQRHVATMALTRRF